MMSKKMKTERLNYISRNQKRLMSDDYIYLRDASNQDRNIDPSNINQCEILSSLFTGYRVIYMKKTQDAMIYVQSYGRPDIFVTLICNSKLAEIKGTIT